MKKTPSSGVNKIKEVKFLYIHCKKEGNPRATSVMTSPGCVEQTVIPFSLDRRRCNSEPKRILNRLFFSNERMLAYHSEFALRVCSLGCISSRFGQKWILEIKIRHLMHDRRNMDDSSVTTFSRCFS